MSSPLLSPILEEVTVPMVMLSAFPMLVVRPPQRNVLGNRIHLANHLLRLALFFRIVRKVVPTPVVSIIRARVITLPDGHIFSEFIHLFQELSVLALSFPLRLDRRRVSVEKVPSAMLLVVTNLGGPPCLMGYRFTSYRSP